MDPLGPGRYRSAMLGVTAAIGEFFAALGWGIVRSGATVGIAAAVSAATGLGLARAARKRKGKDGRKSKRPAR